MNDAVTVCVVERSGDGGGDTDGVGDRELSFALEPPAKGFTFDKGHDVEQQPVRLTAVEQRQEIRVLQIRRDANLAEKALNAEHGAEVRIQNLERDAAIVPEVAREIDGRHAAGADLALDGIASAERGIELVDDGGHEGGAGADTLGRPGALASRDIHLVRFPLRGTSKTTAPAGRPA
jgi:hypothetical protein